MNPMTKFDQEKNDKASEKLGGADDEAPVILMTRVIVWNAKPTAVVPSDTFERASERRRE
jgi:hypothetical protein